MKFNYRFFTKEKIVVVKFSGKFNLGDLLLAAKSIYSDSNYMNDYCGITDLRGCEPNMSEDELSEYLEFVLSNPKALKTKWAIIADTPTVTAFGMLYRSDVSDHEIGVFSTWKGATNFHGVSIEEFNI